MRRPRGPGGRFLTAEQMREKGLLVDEPHHVPLQEQQDHEPDDDGAESHKESSGEFTLLDGPGQAGYNILAAHSAQAELDYLNGVGRSAASSGGGGTAANAEARPSSSRYQ